MIKLFKYILTSIIGLYKAIRSCIIEWLNYKTDINQFKDFK